MIIQLSSIYLWNSLWGTECYLFRFISVYTPDLLTARVLAFPAKDFEYYLWVVVFELVLGVPFDALTLVLVLM